MPKIFYIGDSTVARNTIHTYPQTGMSQGLARYTKPSVPIVSLAKNGRSTKSFLEEHHRVRISAHLLAELSALLVTDIAGRGANQYGCPLFRSGCGSG